METLAPGLRDGPLGLHRIRRDGLPLSAERTFRRQAGPQRAAPLAQPLGQDE